MSYQLGSTVGAAGDAAIANALAVAVTGNGVPLATAAPALAAILQPPWLP